ncbi:MAG TPA: SMC-Scp complex subunit ScpB [Kiritimatiellia bacterium]|nr:SMC-Scp complex subunit ScpB [Kiritimatiellia bacterium]HMO98035.1 SMC-Scp complex subunit ScpB [Kiritimatiellia bacterium]
MTDWNVIPELKQIVGALLFAAREPVSIETIRKTLRDAAKQYEGPVKDFAQVTDDDLRAAIKQLNEELIRDRIGIHVGEVANGYRLQNDLNCGIWIRQMLEKGRSNRLSKPALETLAIIAYRQPCTRSEIEAVRGVAVDAILKNLMEMQLVKAAGRSELPGRPWLFATTQKFLEYFGIKNVQDLPGIEELRRMEKAQAEARRNEAIERAVNEEQSVPDASVGSEAVTGDATTLDTDTPGDETDDERPDQAGNSRAEDDASEDENDEAGVEDEFDDDDDEFDDDEDDEYDDEDEDEDFEDEEDESEEKS